MVAGIGGLLVGVARPGRLAGRHRGRVREVVGSARGLRECGERGRAPRAPPQLVRGAQGPRPRLVHALPARAPGRGGGRRRARLGPLAGAGAGRGAAARAEGDAVPRPGSDAMRETMLLRILKQALPYLRQYSKQVMVVKLGGE